MATNYNLNMDVKVNSAAAETNLKKVNKAASSMGSDSASSAKKASSAFNTLDSSTAKLAKTTQTATSATNTFGKSLTGVVTNMKLVVAAATGFAAVMAISFGKSAVDAASSLQEQVGKFEIVFSDQIDMARKMATELQKSYGLSQRASVEYLGSMMVLLNNMGLTSEAATKMSDSLVKMSVDLGSFYDNKTTNVMADIQSAMVGNFETMKKYGIILNETEIKAEAYRMGIAKVGEELTKTQKVQAAYSVVATGAAKAMGNFADTSGNYANQMKILEGNVENFKATLGEKLLPELTKVVKNFNDWAKAGDNLKTSVDLLVISLKFLLEVVKLLAIGLVGAGIGAFITMINAARLAVIGFTATTTTINAIGAAFGATVAPITKTQAALRSMSAYITILKERLNALSFAWQGALLAMAGYAGYQFGGWLDKQLKGFESYRVFIVDTMYVMQELIDTAKELGRVMSMPFTDMTVDKSLKMRAEDAARNKRTREIAREEARSSGVVSKPTPAPVVKPGGGAGGSGGGGDEDLVKAQEFAKKMKDIRATLNADMYKFYDMDYQYEIQTTIDKYAKLREEAKGHGATLKAINEAEKAEMLWLEDKQNKDIISKVIDAKEKQADIISKQTEVWAKFKIDVMAIQADLTRDTVRQAELRGENEIRIAEASHEAIIKSNKLKGLALAEENNRFELEKSKIKMTTGDNVAAAKRDLALIGAATIESNASLLDSDRDRVAKAQAIKQEELIKAQADYDVLLEKHRDNAEQKAIIDANYAAKKKGIEKKAFDDSRNALEIWSASHKETMDVMYEGTVAANEMFASGFTDALFDFIDGTKSAKDAFVDFARSFLNEVAKMIVQQTLLNALKKVMYESNQKQGYAKLAISAVMGAYGGTAGGTGEGATAAGWTGTTGTSTAVAGWAKGGIFESGIVKAFAKGGVVNSPRVFPMANGMGLIGEAGPEAVMPLRRTAKGELGIIASNKQEDDSRNKKQQIKVEIANIVSPELLDSYMATTRGQNAILNVISNRPGMVKRILQAG